MAENYGKKIIPEAIDGNLTITKLIDNHFTAYNASRIREACHIITEKMSEQNVTVCLTISGALTPTGLGASAIVPLIEDGIVDWIISTGANLYHDLHYALNKAIYQSGKPGSAFDDTVLKNKNIIRIYDLVFDFNVLLDTDKWIYTLIEKNPEFHETMSSRKFHYLIGKYVDAVEKEFGTQGRSILASAYRNNVPIFTSSPGDSTFGMNVAALQLKGVKCNFDTCLDVNESTSIVYNTKNVEKRKSAVVILGGGSPKNFALQTEPQIQEVLKLKEIGHDYFIQFTDARPDTGGLSGATPSEAVSWGKVDPNQLQDSVVAYTDSTIALPLITAYIKGKKIVKKKKNLNVHINDFLETMKNDFNKISNG